MENECLGSLAVARTFCGMFVFSEMQTLFISWKYEFSVLSYGMGEIDFGLRGAQTWVNASLHPCVLSMSYHTPGPFSDFVLLGD